MLVCLMLASRNNATDLEGGREVLGLGLGGSPVDCGWSVQQDRGKSGQLRLCVLRPRSWFGSPFGAWIRGDAPVASYGAGRTISGEEGVEALRPSGRISQDGGAHRLRPACAPPAPGLGDVWRPTPRSSSQGQRCAASRPPLPDRTE